MNSKNNEILDYLNFTKNIEAPSSDGAITYLDRLLLKEKEFSTKINAIKSDKDYLYPVVDGIIDIKKYIKADYRLLWIFPQIISYWIPDGKEPEDLSRDNWSIPKLYSKMTSESFGWLLVPQRIMEATYKLLPNSENSLDAFQSIAYINIHKIPRITWYYFPEEVETAFNNNKSLLYDQIETYNPEIIICCHALKYLLSDNYFDNSLHIPLNSNKPTNNFCYYPLKRRLYINMQHPTHKGADKDYWDNCISEVLNAVSDWESNYRNKYTQDISLNSEVNHV